MTDPESAAWLQATNDAGLASPNRMTRIGATVHRRAALFCVFLSSMSMGGCSAPPIDGAPDDMASEELAVATPTWVHPECDASGLTSPPLGCDGPWSYTEQLLCTDKHPSCPDYCADLGACSLWANGVVAGSTSIENTGQTRTRTCTDRCPARGDGECASACGVEPTPGWCSSLAPARELQIENEAKAAIDAEPDMPWSQRAVRKASAEAVATVEGTEVASETRSITRTPTLIITRTVTTWTCQLQITRAERAYAESAACPCDRVDDTVCTHTCGTRPGFTAPGANLPDNPLFSNQTCTTCDVLPYGTSAEVAAKYDCLSQGLGAPVPTTVTAADFRDALIARLELLLELRGHLLDAAKQATIRAYYTSEDSAAVCHGPLPIEASCLWAGNAGALNGWLQLCQNLDRDDVPVDALRAHLDHCLSTFDLVAQIPPGVCHEQYRRAAASTTRNLLRHAMGFITATGGALVNVGEALDAIDRWYEHAELVVGDDDSWLRAGASAIVGSFWERTHNLIYALPEAVDASSVGSVLAQIDSKNFDVEYQVLAAAFAPNATLDTPPLLSIVGDALRSSIDQLETVSEMHDLACRYRTCAPTSTSQASEMWRLVASLADVTRLDAAVSAATSLNTAHASMRNAFAAIAARHANLRAAYDRARAGSGHLAGITSAHPIAPEAEELAALISLADDRYRNFQTDGLFLGAGARSLHAGMQNKQIVVQQLGQQVSALEAAYASFLDQRVSLVNTLLQELRNGQETRGLLDRIGIILERISNASAELGGLRAREMSERAAWASYLDAFEDMRDSGVFDGDAAANTDQLPALDVSGADARYSGSPASPAQLAVRYPAGSATPWKKTVRAGQSLRFDVRNDWTPSCALRVKTAPGAPLGAIAGPDAGSYGISNIDRLSGPEGYIVQWTGSGFDTRTTTADTTFRMGLSVDACIKLSYGTPVFAEFVTGARLEAWVQACANLSLTQTFSNAESSGTDNRSSASFAGGMHLDNTPYPYAPAGALLLVLTAPGTDTIVDVQVVGRQAAFIAPEDVDAYLVVNDFNPVSSGGRCDGFLNHKLHVEAAQVTSFGATADQLARAMAASLGEIRGAASGILAQGQLVPGEEQLLRLHARQRVAALTGFDVTQLPPAVSEFFETWISAELVSLNRRAEMYRHERELRLAGLERNALIHERDAAAEQSRLVRLAPRWLLRRLQTSRLAQDERALLRYLRDYAPPIFELRYPRALRDLLLSPDASVSAKLQLDQLESMDFAATSDDIAAVLLTLGNKVNDSLESAVANSADYGVVRAGVSFPDPDDYHGAGDPPPPNCGVFAPCNQPAAPPLTTWHAVELTRAKQVWSALRARGKVTFNVTPADLYDSHGGIGQLTCYDSAPIIRKMAVYAVTTDGNDWGQIDYRPALEVAAEQLFPTSTGAPVYVKTDTDWLFTGVPMLGGAENEALSDLRAHDSAAASGLSPFNTFTVDFANFPVPFDQTKQLVVTFELETRPIASPGVAVAECRP